MFSDSDILWRDRIAHCPMVNVKNMIQMSEHGVELIDNQYSRRCTTFARRKHTNFQSDRSLNENLEDVTNHEYIC